MYYLTIFLTFISLNLSANVHETTYSDSYSYRSLISRKINVYGKGYRYQNRIFYREKLQTKKECEKSLITYRSNTNTSDLNLEANFTDLSVRVGVGRLSSVQFACDLKIKTISGSQSIKIDSFQFSFKDEGSAKSFCKSKLEELQPLNYMTSKSVFMKSKTYLCEVETAIHIR